VFSVDVRPAGPVRVVALRGELDYESAIQVEEAADQVLDGAVPVELVVVDGGALRFCDSSGVGALLSFHRRLLAQGGVLRLAALPPSVARVFQLTGLDQVIGMYDSVAAALTARGVQPSAYGTASSVHGTSEGPAA